MTPDELRALADEATPGPGDSPPFSWTGATAGDKMIASHRLSDLAPDLARLCAELGEALEEIASLEDQSELEKAIAQPALAKLSELNNGAEESPALERT